ncbi:hypothetical protein ZHAS_00014427 [Anopheles sinensis]|uniref:Uncharacterized protein n=1 Tax=Anopheles sinensis TaxID=74873 RepID=A0A084W884_ANOSI|nr:hypothetical protein ZHAS_00014427 [Anopheles sinensis]
MLAPTHLHRGVPSLMHWLAAVRFTYPAKTKFPNPCNGGGDLSPSARTGSRTASRARSDQSSAHSPTSPPLRLDTVSREVVHQTPPACYAY